MMKVGSLVIGLAIAVSAIRCSSGNGGTSGTPERTLAPNSYSCDMESIFEGQNGVVNRHICVERPVSSSDPASLRTLTSACDANNVANGLGFSTSRPCKTDEPGCVCGSKNSAEASYFYLQEFIDNPENFGPVDRYMASIVATCMTMVGMLSCFGGAELP